MRLVRLLLIPALLLSACTALADNYTFTQGTGKTAASDTISSVEYPRHKLIFGADGTNSGDVADANPLPIKNMTTSADGWLVSSQTALSNTKVAVYASAGVLGGYMFFNPAAAVTYIQVFDVASAGVTVGTTTPTYVIPIPAGGGANLEILKGIKHATAITVAATTSPTNSTAPSSALVGFFLYK